MPALAETSFYRKQRSRFPLPQPAKTTTNNKQQQQTKQNKTKNCLALPPISSPKPRIHGSAFKQKNKKQNKKESHHNKTKKASKKK
jgi:hypothetical protein